MLDQILTPAQERLLSEEREGLNRLGQSLTAAGASRQDLSSLRESLAQLDRLFLLVVVGEFNSGKSTLINALLGRKVLEEGVTPTTRRIHVLGYADEESREADHEGIEQIAAPIDILRRIQIVDTPGTNALDREHEALTERYVPRSDLVLFVTSADRPLTESERGFIDSIRTWGKKLVLVINKIDFLDGGDERRQVEEYVRSNSAEILGLAPEVFALSARSALNDRLSTQAGPSEQAVDFTALEEYLTGVLDETERIKLKLLNPLGVGLRLAERCETSIDERLDLLQDDVRTLDEIASQLRHYGDDLRSDFRFRLTDVDNELHEFEKRGNEFFDDTLRLARALDLLNKERIRGEYERKVVADTPHRLESKVNEIIDWMVGRELEQWRSTTSLLGRRKASDEEGFSGALGDFDRSRQQLLDTIGRVARSSLDSFDQRKEAQRLAESVRTAVTSAALLEAGAVSLGTLFTMLATTQLADFTGMLAAGTMAVVGLFVLPFKRRRAKADLSRRIFLLRTKMLDTLTAEFDREAARSIHAIDESLAPYTRFVRSRQEDLTGLREELSGLADTLSRLRSRIEAL